MFELCVIRCISLIGLVILFLLFFYFVFVTMDYVWKKLDGWMECTLKWEIAKWSCCLSVCLFLCPTLLAQDSVLELLL